MKHAISVWDIFRPDRITHRATPTAYRIMRSDGKLVHELPAALEVSIGQVAGFPTPEQYEGAAKRALEQAARIRAQQARLETNRASFRQNNS